MKRVRGVDPTRELAPSDVLASRKARAPRHTPLEGTVLLGVEKRCNLGFAVL